MVEMNDIESKQTNNKRIGDILMILIIMIGMVVIGMFSSKYIVSETNKVASEYSVEVEHLNMIGTTKYNYCPYCGENLQENRYEPR